MGALRSSGAIRNTFLAYLASKASTGGSSSVLPIIDNVADPVHSTAFLRGSDIGGDNLVPVDVLLSRMSSDADFAAGYTAYWQLDQLNYVRKFFPNVVGYKFAQSNPQLVAVPSECALWVRFPGSAGIIQCKGSNPSSDSIIIETAGPNNHGALYVSGLWFMGDPTLGVGTADALAFLKLSVAWDAWVWDCRAFGFLGAQRVFDLNGESQLHVRGTHFSRCG